jgi:anti-anti-sigma regulatory factor
MWNEEGNMLIVSTERIGDVVTLHCKGRIVLGDETAILCKALGQKMSSIILDLAEVDAIDAAWLGALISLQAAGIYLKLMNPTEQVRETLRLIISTRFSNFANLSHRLQEMIPCRGKHHGL